MKALLFIQIWVVVMMTACAFGIEDARHAALLPPPNIWLSFVGTVSGLALILLFLSKDSHND